METLKRVGVLLSLTIVLTACPNGDTVQTTAPPDTSATTESTAATTTTAGPSSTSTTLEMDTIPEVQPEGCFYLNGFLVVPEGQAEIAIGTLGGLGLEASLVSAAVALGEGSEESGVIDETLDVLSTDVDPLEVADVLEDEEIEAAPIYAIGVAGHWKFGPGAQPVSRPEATFEGSEARPGDGVIAVVDSGLVADEHVPTWMSPMHVLYNPNRDTESIGDDLDVASHGTFVASLIRYLAPDYRVAFASAQPPVSLDIVENGDTLPSGQFVSTELHVAAAIVRIIGNPELEGAVVSALNLSLGTYACDPGNDPTMLTTMTAMELWFNAFPDSTIFAAGGNEVYQAPFWPAGLADNPLAGVDYTNKVRGVGALNESGEEVVWGQPSAGAASQPQSPPLRPWITDTAPGCDLLGLRGGADIDGATVVAWSGSSFATAVSAALSASIPPSAIEPSRDIEYGDVTALAFERLGCDGNP